MSHRNLGVQYPPPAWVQGCISHLDATFISAFVGALAPRAMVEVGVASGLSSAVLLHALSRVRGAARASTPWLYSFDILDHCYFDPSRRVGALVEELAPEFQGHWRLHVAGAVTAPAAVKETGLASAFIDANHCHPWPTLDLLAILPTLRPGAWVLLHDVRLPEIAPGTDSDIRGAKLLFDAWPWAKRSEPVQGNTGAIRLDGTQEEIHAFCERMLGLPWETSVPRSTLQALGLQTEGVRFEDDRSPSLRAIARLRHLHRAERPLVIWSAGQAGRAFLGHLSQAGFTVEAFVDVDTAKHDQRLDGVEVRSPSTLDASAPERPFVVACGVYGRKIAEDLDSRGFVSSVDYLVV